MSTLTPEQFDALVALTSIRAGAALAGARLVLVDGLPPSVAADSAGVSRQQISNVLTRLREAWELARRVCADQGSRP